MSNQPGTFSSPEGGRPGSADAFPSTLRKKTISVLGATGSIGQTTLSLLSEYEARFALDVITAENNVEQLAFLARRHHPALAVIGNETHYIKLKEMLEGTGIAVAAGRQAVIEAAERKADLMVSGIMGCAGLEPVFAAIENGTDVALATKECLVAAGYLLMETAEKHAAAILPVDSEHNAVFQLLQGQKTSEIRKIILTASGGPLRTLSESELGRVTPEQAVKHPNWSMGAKISVDSATLMNKGLEMIEAYHLFPVAKEQIDVVVHPQSIVHSLVHFNDNSVFAHLSAPHMSVPISYCLGYPDRLPTGNLPLDLTAIGALVFERPDTKRFPCLQLAYDALATDGAAPCILNASNEVAVAAFLEKRIGFTDIPNVIAETLSSLALPAPKTLPDIMETDRLARSAAKGYIDSASSPLL